MTTRSRLGSHPRGRAATESATRPGRGRLLLIVHVSTTVSLLGAALVLLALGVAGVRGWEPQTVYPAMSLVSTWVILPLALVALGTGVAQGALTPWGLVRYWWVAIKLAITTVMTGVVALLVVPGLGRAADAATGPAAEAFFTATQRTTYVVTPAVAVTLLLVAIVLAITKPRWRLRPGSGLPRPSLTHGEGRR